MTKAEMRIQQLFARTALMITDLSSVAFEMAYLRRPVIYYHFDFDDFYGGGHNWRRGYYDYAKDGFGPIVHECDQLLLQVASFVDDPGALTGLSATNAARTA
ncbi:MAG: CDP-glycerol glycerophosphotransferase family protein [Burkholderiaceae bacterium]|nr:CDP-glycerol glycerophosphotransferase family protein [Burkholderiaceae bacterium]